MKVLASVLVSVILFLMVISIRVESITDMRNSTVQVLDPCSGGWGSGVIVGDNIILTAKHVADMGVGELYIRTADGESYSATQWITDSSDDLAIIFCDMNEPCIAEVASLDGVGLGDEVFLLGTPLSEDRFLTITKGIVSHKSGDYVNIDAWGAPGSSGGPVFWNGKVIALCVSGPTMYGASMVTCEPCIKLDACLSGVVGK